MIESAEPDQSLGELLPLRSMAITLEFLQVTSIAYFHQPRLTALLRWLLPECEHYEQLFVIDCPESGRINFQTGDFYRFNLIALAGAEVYLDILFERLQALPEVAPKRDAAIPLRDNLRLHNIQDVFSGETLCHWQQAHEYGVEQLYQEAQHWQGLGNSFKWQFLTPARVLQEKEGRAAKGEARYCHDAQHFSAALLLNRLQDSTNDLIRRRSGIKTSRSACPTDLVIASCHVFWLDSSYQNGKGQKPMGGVMGQLRLQGGAELSLGMWSLLVLGQYIGIGQRRTFGWGRYQLLGASGEHSFRRVLPAQTLWQQISRDDNLLSAYKKVSKTSQTDWAETEQDGPELAQQTGHEQQLATLQRLLVKLEQGRYQVPNLRGHVLEKNNGGLRPLAVPPFWDRVVQRAVAQVLTPMFEQLMDAGSYGYRPGRSRHNARDQIQRYWRAGYHWVFESDLKDFFDSVQHHWLEVRLQGFLGDDPLRPVLMQWMGAAVDYQGRTIERRAGLPQGSPLSPLLANMVLDDFDADIEKAGFKMVRFADDFIVMCKSPKQARQVELRVRNSLAEHGLNLNESKTHIKAMDEGLKYLGFLFVNDMAVDASGQSEPHKKTAAQPLSANSWLAQISQQPLHAVQEKTSQQQLLQMASQQQSVALGVRDDSGIVLCISGAQALLTTRAERIKVSRDEVLLLEQPWQHLQAVVLFGRHHITTPALRTAMENNVAVHFADGMGRYQGTAWSGQPLEGHQLWLQQQQLFGQSHRALGLAIAIVDARLRHMAEVLRNRGEADYKTIRVLLKELPKAKNLSQLNGYEGAAAARYFSAVAKLLPAEFHFNGRNRRPPKDPFNVLLSLGYSLLYGYADSLLRVSGLLPWLGFYHQPHGDHRTLASDLMEPFRHLVERKALTMVRKGQLKPGDFYTRDDGSCAITKTALKHYLAELSRDFEGDLQGQPTARAEQRLSRQMLKQNRSLIAHIRHGQAFCPWGGK